MVRRLWFLPCSVRRTLFHLSLLVMMLVSLGLFVAFASRATTSVISLRQSAAPIENCPGYRASNVAQTDAGLTADLSLAGAPCNTYGTDLTDLKLEVQYQTGKHPWPAQ